MHITVMIMHIIIVISLHQTVVLFPMLFGNDVLDKIWGSSYVMFRVLCLFTTTIVIMIDTNTTMVMILPYYFCPLTSMIYIYASQIWTNGIKTIVSCSMFPWLNPPYCKYDDNAHHAIVATFFCCTFHCGQLGGGPRGFPGEVIG